MSGNPPNRSNQNPRRKKKKKNSSSSGVAQIKCGTDIKKVSDEIRKTLSQLSTTTDDSSYISPGHECMLTGDKDAKGQTLV